MAHEIHQSFAKEAAGPSSKAMVRCPHCAKHFYSDGGQVSPEKEGEAYQREHDEIRGMDERTRDYDEEFHHYYERGESKAPGFARGGRVDAKDKDKHNPFRPDTFRERHLGSPGPSGPPMRHSLGPTGVHRPTDEEREEESTPSFDDYRHGFYAEGGRVDGAGKVDGIHHHPSECSHLASGGVCRHQPSQRRGGDHADDHVRHFSEGGGVGGDEDGDAFARHLARRRLARRSSGRGE